MATFSGSYVPINQHTNARVNEIIDNLIDPSILTFRQITIYDEIAVVQADNLTWKVNYGNWNETFPVVIRKNSQKLLDTQVFNIDRIFGTFEIGPVVRGDNVNVTYNFDYFGVGVLAGFIFKAIDIINTAAFGSPSSYDIDTAPSYWNGVIADLVQAMCMEKLILDYDLWYGRLIFAIPNAQLEDGSGGDTISTLETLKQNAEERAYKTLDNEKFKTGNYLSVPTAYYYQGIRGIGRSGTHGIRSYGKQRGGKNNKYI
jgi:hypothetical protein